MNAILEFTPGGLFCREGDFHIDPRRPVKRAVITHAHADHARVGSRSYLCAKDSQRLLQARLGREASIETLEYGEVKTINAVKLSLHPAGHILGSAQLKVERNGNIWVVSGDYKTDSDPTCAPLEPLRCHTFITDMRLKWPGGCRKKGTTQKPSRVSLMECRRSTGVMHERFCRAVH